MNHLSFLLEMFRLLWPEVLSENLLTDRQAKGYNQINIVSFGKEDVESQSVVECRLEAFG